MRLLASGAELLQTAILLFLLLFCSLLIYQEIKKHFKRTTELVIFKNRSTKPFEIYLLSVLSLLLIISLFQSGVSNTSTFSHLGIFVSILRKVESHKTTILLLGNLSFVILSLPAISLIFQKNKNAFLGFMPLLIFINIRTVFQDKAFNIEFYAQEIAVATTLFLIGLSCAIVHREILLFQLKTFLNSIIILSLFLFIVQRPTVVTTIFGGGIGLDIRFIGVCVTPTLFAGLTSLSFVVQIFDYKVSKSFAKFLLMSASLISTYLSGSRTGIFICAISIFIAVNGRAIQRLNSNWKRIFLYILFLTPPIAILNGVSFEALNPRTAIYKVGLENLSDSGIWGLGSLILTQGDNLKISYLHNQMLQTALEFGAFGLLFLIIAISKWLNRVELKISNLNLCIAIWLLLFMATENPFRVHTPIFASVTAVSLIALKVSVTNLKLVRDSQNHLTHSNGN